MAKYSPSTKGIYDQSVYVSWPTDALDIPNDLFSRYRDGLTCGAFDVVDGVVIEYVEPAPSVSERAAATQKALEIKIQEMLDAKARSMNFDNILSGISNASLPVGEYRQSDGAALLLWRARVWKKAAEIRDAYFSGTMSEPTWEDLVSELPEFPIS